MSEALFDKNSWNRALGPAIRATGYFAAGVTVFFLVYVILIFLASLANLQNAITTLFGVIGPILMVFYATLVFFKILDEEGILSRPAVINPK